MNQNLENKLEQVEKKLESAVRERNIWQSSKGGVSNAKIAEHLVKALEKERDNLITQINNQNE